jgi:hypothetical protein
MDRANTAKTLATAAACLAVVVPLIGGFIVPGHSHVVNFISELGAAGTQWGAVVSWAGFLPIGVLTLGFLIFAAPLLRLQGAAKVGYWLLSFIGIAYVGSAFAPCDLGCPVSGSPTQLVHNLLGLMEYLGGGVGLLVFSKCYFKDNAGLTRPSTATAFLLRLRLHCKAARVGGISHQVIINLV